MNMIDFPIVDTHLHLWDTGKLKYPWLDDIPLLNRPHLLEDYRQACSPLNVEKMVFMQSECVQAQYRDEVEWITELATQHDERIKGIISWAPMEKGAAVIPALDVLKENKLIKGIRRIIQFEEDMDFCIKPDFIKGIKLLPEYGYTFDICIDYRHTKNTIRFVEQCPDVKFVLDHIGKPNVKGRVLDPWRAEIKTLSGFPNVACKVSSLATEADHRNWTFEDIRPYAEHIFECFGFDRTIYASDWPVSSQAATIPVCVDTIEKIVSCASRAELKKLFHDNAESFYGV
jgi:L-fuconolactonase